jgi:alkanesulfonate monooxygenase SsuD/methylene tetrahydromethanopterin reductase-like flavin-dependent oxidoreductase (luciferase family)
VYFPYGAGLLIVHDRSAVEGWSKASPGVAKWTKHTVAKHITIGGLGATVVGTPVQVADEFERWVREADVDGFNIVSTCFLSRVNN